MKQRILGITSLLALSLMALPAAAALQGSAGNTIIRNTVSVSYNDAGGAAQTPVTARVDITVTTVSVAPTIKSISPNPGSTGATGATQTYAVEIVTNSNGPGTISLTAADGTPINLTVSGTGPAVQAPGSVFLGSSIIDPSDAKLSTLQSVAAGGTITFSIPNDGGIPTDTATTGGASGNNSVNALSVGDTVYIYDGTAYIGKFSVTAVTDNAAGAGSTAASSSITLQNTSGAPVSFTPAFGWMIVEARSLNVTVTQGAVAIATNPASWVTTFTGSMGGLNGTGSVTTNAASGLLTVSKYVRNHTTPVVGATPVTPPINGGGVTFYQTGVSGKPGDTLEYLRDNQLRFRTGKSRGGNRCRAYLHHTAQLIHNLWRGYHRRCNRHHCYCTPVRHRYGSGAEGGQQLGQYRHRLGQVHRNHGRQHHDLLSRQQQ